MNWQEYQDEVKFYSKESVKSAIEIFNKHKSWANFEPSSNFHQLGLMEILREQFNREPGVATTDEIKRKLTQLVGEIKDESLQNIIKHTLFDLGNRIDWNEVEKKIKFFRPEVDITNPSEGK